MSFKDLQQQCMKMKTSNNNIKCGGKGVTKDVLRKLLNKHPNKSDSPKKQIWLSYTFVPIPEPGYMETEDKNTHASSFENSAGKYDMSVAFACGQKYIKQIAKEIKRGASMFFDIPMDYVDIVQITKYISAINIRHNITHMESWEKLNELFFYVYEDQHNQVPFRVKDTIFNIDVLPHAPDAYDIFRDGYGYDHISCSIHKKKPSLPSKRTVAKIDNYVKQLKLDSFMRVKPIKKTNVHYDLSGGPNRNSFVIKDERMTQKKVILMLDDDGRYGTFQKKNADIIIIPKNVSTPSMSALKRAKKNHRIVQL